MPRPNIRPYTNFDNYVYSHTRKIKETVLIQQKDRPNCFRESLDEYTLKILLAAEIDIEEAVENITKAIQKQHGKQYQIETNKTLKKNAQKLKEKNSRKKERHVKDGS
jgi:hypothetical protein